MSKILILGASGAIAQFVGQELTDQAELTLYLRTPAKLTHPTGTIVQGDVFDADQLTAAMTGQDVIFSDLGWAHMAEMATAVTQAAAKTQVTRLLWVATAGIYDEIPAADRVEAERLYGRADDPTTYFGDERVGADIIEGSPLTTTIIRPNTLTDEPEIEAVVVSGRHEVLQGGPISRRTVAHFISQLLLAPDQYQNDSIGLGRKI